MQRETRFAIGIMSGTSLDGIDVAAARISGVFVDTVLEVVAYKTYPFQAALRTKIEKVSNGQCFPASVFSKLHVELGEVYAEAVKHFCKEFHLDFDRLDFIALHGQTVFHDPSNQKGEFPSTWQIGDAAVVAERCQTPVVSNFRAADIAAGGQGAPLVPYADYLLFRSKEKARAIHNIGGIANTTILPRNASLDEVKAFDTGPGNLMINRACEKLYNMPFDVDGKIAEKGTIIPALIEELMAHPFVHQSPPKSTGREVFGERLTDQLMTKYHTDKREDLVATFTYFTAQSIARAYAQFVLPKTNIDEIYLCGGGAKNRFLVALLKDMLPAIKFYDIEVLGMDAKSKEALAFIVLANETLHFRSANIPGATGAKHQIILGQVTYVNPVGRSKT